MFHVENYNGNKDEQQKIVLNQLKALIEDEKDLIANLANAAALLNHYLDDINWVGFYLLKDNQLVLGPFQGMPACVRIPLGKGVCGTSVSERKTLRVANVHEFPGHIACDAASNSEIVVPIINGDDVIGVLDIDSPSLNRFDEEDEVFLKKFVTLIVESL
ncbi:GAF domain-containing protein [Metabacillus malikii]|uniref:GAF domain-containing protein n=1 Tax=Metabacillus malikii TaxID=1504265 RepID=A0ABT9ZFL9_9BACI|nr:GAF domain-containing protein [Metabacillus malikii]MDQ0231061.1 GAF domain-containing protein [Metabacillus malikii]